MRPDFSAFLDLTRICAALTVFVAHLLHLHSSQEIWRTLPLVAHTAVIVFFVLSGYLIAWSAAGAQSARDYGLTRAARIYSVAVPALALTYLIDYAMGHITYQHAQPWKYLPLFLAFATDFWFLSEDAFSNVPYWSLSYEVWYYVLFGIVFFGRGSARWLMALLVVVLMGPRHWLLLPVWVLGAVLHSIPRIGHPGPVLAASLVGFTILAASDLPQYLNALVNEAWHGAPNAYLRYSRFFLSDYVFAVLVALAIVGARDADLGFLLRWKTLVAAAASVSFSLYLIHYPLLLAFGRVFPNNVIGIGAATLVCTIVFGILFERNKRVAHRLISIGLSPFPTARAGTR